MGEEFWGRSGHIIKLVFNFSPEGDDGKLKQSFFAFESFSEWTY